MPPTKRSRLFYIPGAQIIDLMVLVVDINKGIQTQTAECLVIGEIICDKMLVVLNKVDLVPEAKRKVRAAIFCLLIVMLLLIKRYLSCFGFLC